MAASRRGTGFVNLQNYLGLNQGGAAALGNGLAQDVGMSQRNAQASIDAAGMEARNQALSGGVGGSYSGPQSFGDAANMGALQNQVADAQKQASAAATQVGRAELLAKKYGPNTWGGGQLDAALAGAGGGSGALANATGGAARLSEYLGNTASGVNQFIGQQRSAQAPQQPTKTAPTPGANSAPRPGAPYNQRKRDDLEKARGGRP